MMQDKYLRSDIIEAVLVAVLMYFHYSFVNLSMNPFSWNWPSWILLFGFILMVAWVVRRNLINRKG